MTDEKEGNITMDDEIIITHSCIDCHFEVEDEVYFEEIDEWGLSQVSCERGLDYDYYAECGGCPEWERCYK